MIEEAKWYVIHTYSGYENKVSDSILNAVENRQLHHLIREVNIPTEIVVEVKDNQKKEVEYKLFPSYVLIKMILTDDSWYVVRNIRGVTGFIGEGTKPVPLSDAEVARFGVGRKSIEVTYSVGDSVMVDEGYLAGFIGVVGDINMDTEKVSVTVSMMGKEVLVELELTQVKPLE